MVYDPPLRSPYVIVFEYHDRLMASLEECYLIVSAVGRQLGTLKYDLVYKPDSSTIFSYGDRCNHTGGKRSFHNRTRPQWQRTASSTRDGWSVQTFLLRRSDVLSIARTGNSLASLSHAFDEKRSVARCASERGSGSGRRHMNSESTYTHRRYSESGPIQILYPASARVNTTH